MGKYELVRHLATGGMAEVFLAKAAGPMGFEKTIVVKRIRPHLMDDPQFLQMFLGEAKLAAQLNHPNIVQIFDFGEADGAYYIAMEYVDGPNLRVLAQRANAAGQPLPFALVAKLVSFACEGLAYAHDYVNPETGQPLNIVHRDISPDNIVLATSGAVKVVDFGIAKAAEQLYQTRSGLKKGKLAYMSPEYLKGNQLDRRADVFALGVVLYELIGNKKPYDAESEISLMHAKIYEPMVPIRSRRPDVPPALEAIVDKSLARERDERYQDCRELQTDLERFVIAQGEPLGASHLAKLVASLPAAPESGAPARTPSKPKTPSGQKTPAGQERPSGPKTPAKKESGASGEKRGPMTPARALAAAEVVPTDRTVKMTAEELEAKVASIRGGAASMPVLAPEPPTDRAEPPNDRTVKLNLADIPLPPKKSARKAEPLAEPNVIVEAQKEERPAPLPPAPRAPARPRPAERAAPSPLPVRTIALAAAGLLLVGGGIALVTRLRTPAPPPEPTRVEPPPEPEQKPPEPPVETKVADGTLKVTSSVKSVVKVAKQKGPAPFTIELPPGKYPVEVVDPATGYWMKRLEVEVEPGATSEVRAEIGKGSVVFNSPPGVQVFVDGEPQAHATSERLELVEGRHRFRFVKAPREGVQDAVIEAGKVKTVDARFQ